MFSLAKAAGVPVFCIDREINSTNAATAQMLSDSYSGCVKLGQFFVRTVGKEGEYAALLGIGGDNNTWNRSKGFHSVVDRYANLVMVAQQSGEFDRAKGLEVMEAILQAHPNIKAVFCGNDAMAMGAYQALVTAGKADTVKVFGLALGLFNGIAITRFKLPPFGATLGLLSIARGLTMLWTGGFPVTDLGPQFGFIGAGFWLGVPMAVWISAARVVIFYAVSKHTTLGRYIYAVGGSEKATAFSGINVNRVKLWVYALGGALAAVAGLIVTARLDAADPKAGLGYELDSIAAVVIGGTSLSGGRGSILGTVLGCLIIGVLNNGLFLLDVSPFWQQVVKGFVILAAVAADKLGARKE